ILHPGQQGWAYVETHPGIIVYYLCYPAFRIQYPRCRITDITLCIDPVIPVVIRVCRLLKLHLVEPGVFSWRLIEMPVNTDIVFFHLFYNWRSAFYIISQSIFIYITVNVVN